MSNHITILVMLIFVAEVWQAMKLELAAIGGNVEARYNVGRTEALAGNIDRALKHFMMLWRVDIMNL